MSIIFIIFNILPNMPNSLRMAGTKLGQSSPLVNYLRADENVLIPNFRLMECRQHTTMINS